jgi:DNA polymerase/3'-5' exonuclease PolX
VSAISLDNVTVAARLDEYAALLELAGAGYYTSRAYRRAAELIRATPAPIAELVRTGRARKLRGIGPGIERRLRELVETGEIAELRELERTVSPELAAFARGARPRSVRRWGSGRPRSSVPRRRRAGSARYPAWARRPRRASSPRLSAV